MRFMSTLNYQEDISILRWLRSFVTQGLLLRVKPYTSRNAPIHWFSWCRILLQNKMALIMALN